MVSKRICNHYSSLTNNSLKVFTFDDTVSDHSNSCYFGMFQDQALPATARDTVPMIILTALVKRGCSANALLQSKKFSILIQVMLNQSSPMDVYLLKKKA